MFYQLDLSTASGKDRLDSAAGGKGKFRGRLDIKAIYGCTLATIALGSDKALRLLRPQARLQQVRVADLPGTPACRRSQQLTCTGSQ